MNSYQKLGKYLREIRLRKGLAQALVARELGYVSGQFISNMERGRCGIPLRKMRRLRQLYGIPKAKLVRIMVSAYEEELWEIL